MTEEALLAASTRFQVNFVSRISGILRRTLVRAAHGGYADLVFFKDKATAEHVARL